MAPNPTTPAPRPTPGKALNWSDDDLDRLSEVSEADLVKAVALWQQVVTGPLASLMQAELQDVFHGNDTTLPL